MCVWFSVSVCPWTGARGPKQAGHQLARLLYWPHQLHGCCKLNSIEIPILLSIPVWLCTLKVDSTYSTSGSTPKRSLFTQSFFFRLPSWLAFYLLPADCLFYSLDHIPSPLTPAFTHTVMTNRPFRHSAVQSVGMTVKDTEQRLHDHIHYS